MSTATVGVNLLWLVPGVVGGSEEYTLRLLRALSDTERPDIRLRLYANPALTVRHPDLAQRFEVVTAPDPGRAKGGRVALEHSWLAAAGRGDAVVHHAGGVVPLVRSSPAVVTVHDVQPLDHPANFGLVKRRWLGAMIPHAVRSARLVLTPSRFTADRLVERFGLDERRLAVVSQGLAPVQSGVVDPETDRRLRDRYGRYLLLPAIAYAHKRHADLIGVLDRLRDRHPDLAVVFTGGPGPETGALGALTASLGLDRRVHRLGRVDEADLDALYRSAEAVVFPSAYEGFGNPVLEALARGVPTVTSDIPPLREIGAGATLTAPVGAVDDLAAAVDRVLTEPETRRRLTAAGPPRAAHYHDGAAGRRLADAYRRALEAWS